LFQDHGAPLLVAIWGKDFAKSISHGNDIFIALRQDRGMKHIASHLIWPDGPGTLQLAELLGALSHALDATEGQPVGHAIRVTRIGCAIGDRLGLPQADLHDLYYTLLLKDLGCSSNAARICQLYQADDQAFKQAFKLIDNRPGPALKFLLDQTARGRPILTRARTLAQVIRQAGPIVDDLIKTRCEQGADIARAMGFSDTVAKGIHALDEHWDGSGRPDHLAGDAIPLFARIALVAQVADVFMIHGTVDDAITEVTSRSGRWFDPAVAQAAVACLQDAALLADLAAPDLAAGVFADPASTQAIGLDDAQLDRIIDGFARVIDAKSPFTRNHSARVASYVSILSRTLDCPAPMQIWLRRAALLHDIGKLGVPNRILDKAGALDPDERRIIEGHTGLGAQILGQIGLFAPVAHLAHAHHERLDGAGYPRKLEARQIGLDLRILTCADIYDALSAERPYKPAFPPDKVRGIIAGLVGRAIDPACHDALCATLLR
jgi:putative nucleotidyltransferase with HDIG domain